MLWRSLLQRPFAGFSLATFLAIPAVGIRAAEIIWERKSATAGDLKAPNGGDQQTHAAVADFDGDGIADFQRRKAPRPPGKGQAPRRRDLRPEASREAASGLPLSLGAGDGS
ncbi:MAG: hypothetical protein ACUVYA_02920 [Planctomycetota bacterium]